MCESVMKYSDGVSAMKSLDGVSVMKSLDGGGAIYLYISVYEVKK